MPRSDIRRHGLALQNTRLRLAARALTVACRLIVGQCSFLASMQVSFTTLCTALRAGSFALPWVKIHCGLWRTYNGRLKLGEPLHSQGDFNQVSTLVHHPTVVVVLPVPPNRSLWGAPVVNAADSRIKNQNLKETLVILHSPRKVQRTSWGYSSLVRVYV